MNCFLIFLIIINAWIIYAFSYVMNLFYIFTLSKRIKLVRYFYNGKIYYFPLVISMKEKIQIHHIFDENNIDITKKITPIMGPSLDFYSLVITPKMLGYNSLSFKLENGDEINFGNNDKIAFPES
jgi:hypothetical protein